MRFSKSPLSCHASLILILCCLTAHAQDKPANKVADGPDFPLATPVAPVLGTPVPLTTKGKTDYFLKSAFSAESLGRVLLMTSLGQIGGVSEDWGTGAGAYGRRLGSRYAGHFLSSTVRYGIGAVRGEDPRFFYASGKTGFKSRTGFVLNRTFVVQMDDGSQSVALGRLAGTVSGNLLQSYMRKRHPDLIRTGLQNSGYSIGGDLAIRMLREFWPEIKHKFRK